MLTMKMSDLKNRSRERIRKK